MAKVVSPDLCFETFFCTGEFAELWDGCVVDENLGCERGWGVSLTTRWGLGDEGSLMGCKWTNVDGDTKGVDLCCSRTN